MLLMGFLLPLTLLKPYFIPKTIFKNMYLVLKFIGGALVLSGFFALAFKNTIKENCTLKTTLLSLFLSATASFSLYMFLNVFKIMFLSHPEYYPYEYPFGIVLGFVCLVVFVFLLWLYGKLRKVDRKVKGIIIDVGLFLVWLLPFLMLLDWLHHDFFMQ